MTQLPIGPPTRPPTPLNAEGLKRIADRLALVLDTRGYGDAMTPAVKSTMATLITQDLPALLSYVIDSQVPLDGPPQPDLGREADIGTHLWPLFEGAEQ
jgi:hypothetical protein